MENENPSGAGAGDDIAAVGAIVKALRPFKEEDRQRIVDSALTLLGGAERRRELPRDLSGQSGVEAEPEQRTERKDESAPPEPRDIRELREQKQPRTANEMAAVVAYYLSRLAPEELRRDFITAGDVKKYFEQARFLQPGDALQTLINAKNAGYFDSLERGKYRLNPVGFNLVTHGLPKKSENGSAVRIRQRGRPRKQQKAAAKSRKR